MISFTTGLHILFLIVAVDWYDPLPLKKTLTLHNIIKLIKSVFNKDKNSYHYNVVLEEGLYQSTKNKDNR